MLWDLIRDFFVQHVFGGITSDGTLYNTSFGFYYDDGGIFSLDYYSNNNIVLKSGFTDASGEILYYSIGDWLSTTATIISITIIVVLCCLFVYKIIKLIGGLIR